MEKLEDLCKANPEKYQIIKKANVTKLIKGEKDNVIGCEYEFKGEYKSVHGPVIIATGTASLF